MSKRFGLGVFSRQVTEIMPLIIREFGKREDNALARGQITCPQMVTLHFLLRKPRATATEIAHLLGVKGSSASVLVDRLLRAGMIAKTRDEADRRVTWLRVTPKGRKVITQILTQKRRSVRAVFARLTDAERASYLSILKKIKAGIEKESSDA